MKNKLPKQRAQIISAFPPNKGADKPKATEPQASKAASAVCSLVIVSLFVLFAGGAAAAVIMGLVALYRLL